MDHAEAIEHIEIAAVEPGGLDRLMAGDTAISVAVAGHLAGCPACVDELTRIRRSSAIARGAVRSVPDPMLRDRTLAFVGAVGRQRAAPAEATTADGGVTDYPRAVTRGRRGRWGLVVAAAAVVMLAVGAGFVGGTLAQRGDVDRQQDDVVALEETAVYALAIAGQPDATRVELTATPASPASSGTIMFSPSGGDLVAVASDLAPLEAGQEYGCWVEVNGERQRMGRMDWAGRLWTWVGPVDGLDDLPTGTVFGVSLGTPGGGTEGVPVLTGNL